MLMLCNEFPKELCDRDAHDIINFTSDSILIHISGNKKPALFLSCLIHGNETSSWTVIQSLVKKYGTQNWPRETYIFIGNVTAAAAKKRHLPGQPDYNRIWDKHELPEHKMAQEVLSIVTPAKLFAAIDLHNTSGKNPLFCVVEHDDPRHFHLAQTFCSQSMYDAARIGALSETFGFDCPAITIEAGQSDDSQGLAALNDFFDTIYNWDDFPTPQDVKNHTILDAIGAIKIAKNISVAVGDQNQNSDLVFVANLDEFNFKEMPSGTTIAKTTSSHPITLIDAAGVDITSQYFAVQDGRLTTIRPFIPTMISDNAEIIKSDSWAYVLNSRIHKI